MRRSIFASLLTAMLAAMLAALLATACDGTPPDDGDAGTPTDDAGPPDPLRVETDLGPVTGTASGDLRVYLGIPYAAPPVGDLRFRPPQPHEGWDDTLVADAFGAACPQLDRASDTYSGDEDCLTLNVWAHDDDETHPVMVFIHGGGSVQGSSNLSLYEASNLARAGDVVVVTLNYRLGALGYHATDALVAEGPAGNQGIRDQIAALDWVQRNVAAFGGDADAITVFGESAGAVSICALLGASAADGLFHRAILQSGGGCYGYPALRTGTVNRASMIERGDAITAAAGCDAAPDELACMRALSAEAVIRATWDGGGSVMALGLPDIGPGIDGDLLTEQPIDRVERGDADVPIAIGSNADEMALFAIGTAVPTAAAYERMVRTALGATLGDQVLAIYPASDYATPKDAWIAVSSDIGFICPAMAFADAARAGTEPAYAYHFTHVAGGLVAGLGAFHGLELAYIFERWEAGYVPRETDLRVVESMQRAWTSFARDGAPDVRPEWPAYDPGAATIWIAADPPAVAAEIREGRCDELAALGLVR